MVLAITTEQEHLAEAVSRFAARHAPIDKIIIALPHHAEERLLSILQRLKQLPDPVVEKTKQSFSGGSMYSPKPAQRHFDALKRLLDRKEPDYAT